MKKHLWYILPLLLVLAFSPIWADDYVDDAYYWDDASIKIEAKDNDKKVKTQQDSIPPKVEIIQANDTVVKAVIRR